MSTNIFSLAYGHPTPETNIAMLEHKVGEPARTFNMVPDLDNQYLISGGKFSEAGYVLVCDVGEVSIYYDHTAKITVS